MTEPHAVTHAQPKGEQGERAESQGERAQSQGEPADTLARARYRDVFADPIFRVLFWSRSLSIGAGTLRILALSVVVYDATGSALLTAITFGIGFVPQVVGGTLFGALADRLAPRRLIVGGYLLECAVAAALALGHLPIGVSLALVAVVATLSPVFNGASNRLVAESLTGDAYVLGRSLSNVASAGAQLLGLAAGGVAVSQLGPARALLVTAGCQLLAATWVRFGLPRLLPVQSGTGSAVRQSWRVTGQLLRDREVRALLLVQWLPPSFVTGAEALVVPYAAERGYPAGSAGLLLASVPVGMLVGNLAVGRLVRPATRERLVAPILVLFGVPVMALAAPLPLTVVTGLLFVAGAGFSYALGVQRPFLESLGPAVRGQGFAVLTTGLMTLQGIGPLLTGVVAEYVSISASMLVAGAATVLVGIAWSHTRARRAVAFSQSAMPLG
jgi:predicted MFS family arabinose efflux permease